MVQGSLEDLDRKAIQMSNFDIPEWAHLYTLANYYENCQDSYFIIYITINFFKNVLLLIFSYSSDFIEHFKGL